MGYPRFRNCQGLTHSGQGAGWRIYFSRSVPFSMKAQVFLPQGP